MTTEAGAGERRTRPNTGLAAQLREGRGYVRLYDTYAPQLYQYCWTLLGPDEASEAVYEALLSAVRLLDRLSDDSDLRPWLFALARSASQRRGFNPESPYTRLATTSAESPVVEMALRLPPSHRELLELYLRHGLPPSQIAKIHGLDPDLTGELCRAAVRRATDICTERAPVDGQSHTDRPRLEQSDLSEILTLLEPPAPPEGLRHRVLQDCTVPSEAAEQREVGAVPAPLGGDGFPLHRDRSRRKGGTRPHSGSGAAVPAGREDSAEEAAEPTAERAPKEGAPTPRRPGRVFGPASLLTVGGSSDEWHTHRRRWPVPAISGLATVGVALALWGTALLAGGPPDGTGPSLLPDPTSKPPAAGGVNDDMMPSTAPAQPEQPGASTDAPESEATLPPRDGTDTPGGPVSDTPSANPSPTPDAPDDEAPPEDPPEEAPEDPPEEPPEDEEPEGEDDSGSQDDTISRFFEGVRDIFGPGG